jgi:hypothetical protein
VVRVVVDIKFRARKAGDHVTSTLAPSPFLVAD